MEKTMKKMNFGLYVLFLCFAFSHHANASDETWDYKDWSVITKNNIARYTTNGNAVHGHQFAFVKVAGGCSADFLWISLSTHEKGMENLEGRDAAIQMRVGDEQFQIEVPLVSVAELTPGINIALFTNFVAGDAMISLLKTGQRIEVTIVSPEGLASKFDIPAETFSLNVFTAARLKTREICEGLETLTCSPTYPHS